MNNESMKNEDEMKYALPIAILSTLGKIEGKTKMQKIVGIIQFKGVASKYSSKIYNYELYHHGPFSSDLAEILDELISAGMIQLAVSTSPKGNYAYTYSLTKLGKEYSKVFEARKVLSESIKNTISEICNQTRNLSLPDLVRLAYAEFDCSKKEECT